MKTICLRHSIDVKALNYLVILVVCLLTGCDTQLVSNLSERDANQVMAVLLRAKIDARKDSGDVGKTWFISVPDNRVVESLELLRANGLPQTRYVNLGEVFKKEGLISTPIEERVRFIYGVSQELSDTLSRIDGVVTARVHIVMPQNDPFAPNSKPSSASVFVKHRPEFRLATHTAPIKNLVAHSVEGLQYDAVSVTFVAVEDTAVLQGPQDPTGWGISLWLTLTAILIAMLGVLWPQSVKIKQFWPERLNTTWRIGMEQIRLKLKKKP